MKLNQPIKTILPLAAFAAVAMTGAAQAAATAGIITPTSISTNGEGAIYSALTGLLDGVGLSGNGDSGDILTETHAWGSSANSWHSNNGNGAATVMTFDLGGTFNVDSIHIWNDNQSNGVVQRSVKTLDISFSSDGTNFTNLIDNLGDFLLPTHVPLSDGLTPVSTLSFTAVSGVTHIRLADFQQHGTTFTAMDEVRFGEAVPEPSTTVLLGLGGLALILRRRK